MPPLCSAALRRLRGCNYDVEAEMEEMREEERKEREEGRLSVLNLFTFRPLRWQLISIIVLMAGQQLSGINAVRGATSPQIFGPRGDRNAQNAQKEGSGVAFCILTPVKLSLASRRDELQSCCWVEGFR